MSESDFPEISEIDKNIEEIDEKRKNINDRKRQLSKRREQLEKELEKLKDWIWKTDNPNIVELRRELLAAARLAYDENEEFEEDEDEDEFDLSALKHKHFKKIDPYIYKDFGIFGDETDISVVKKRNL